jgi:hypothetical protein
MTLAVNPLETMDGSMALIDTPEAHVFCPLLAVTQRNVSHTQLPPGLKCMMAFLADVV